MVDISGSRQLSGKAEGRRVRISVFGSTAGTGRRTVGRRTEPGKKFNRIKKKAKKKTEVKKENPAIKPPKAPIEFDMFGNDDDDDGDDGDDGGGDDGGDDGGDGDGDDGAGDS